MPSPSLAVVAPPKKRSKKPVVKSVAKPSKYVIHGTNIALGVLGIVVDGIDDAGRGLRFLSSFFRKPVDQWTDAHKGKV